MDTYNIDNLITSLKNELISGVNIELLRVKYLGKKSDLTQGLKQLSSLRHEDKKIIGFKLNNIKNKIAFMLNSAHTSIADDDLTLPISLTTHGHLHPTDYVVRNIYTIMSKLGFII